MSDSLCNPLEPSKTSDCLPTTGLGFHDPVGDRSARSADVSRGSETRAGRSIGWSYNEQGSTGTRALGAGGWDYIYVWNILEGTV